MPGDAGAARGRPQERGEDAHHRRLAGAVGPEEAVDLAVADLEVEPVDGPDATFELADELLDFDGGAHYAGGGCVLGAAAVGGRSGCGLSIRSWVCSARITCMTALMSARCVNACGKLPRWRPVRVSISSA